LALRAGNPCATLIRKKLLISESIISWVHFGLWMDTNWIL
jgi:hypothetical protein